MSPRTAAVNQRRRDASRSRILDAALRLFGEHGYGATPIDAIVRAAGISPGLLYHYFPSKHALLAALFDASMADVRESFALADREPDPVKRLPALLRGISAIVQRRRHFWALSYGVRMQPDVLAGLDGEIQASARRILEVLERYLKDAGRPQPALEAALLFAQIDGMHQHYVLDPEHYPLDALTDALVARYAGTPAGPRRAATNVPARARRATSHRRRS